MGVLAALVRRGRTGLGEEVSTSLTDSMTSMLAFLATNYFANGQLPQRTGNDHALASPYGLFEASDGQIAVAPSNDSFYFKLLAALDLQHLKDRPEFANNTLRFEHRTAINGEINARTRLMPVAHWIDVINRAGVPCGRVLNVAEVFADPQTQHQKMRVTIDHPQHGALDVLGFPIKFTQAPCTMHRPPPDLGGDTDEILRELGLAPDQIHHLRQAKVI
jgi:crotonobetainyl-CoA:carnitine CoA-transferase CaiB-like acyl-CoA transferase